MRQKKLSQAKKGERVEKVEKRVLVGLPIDLYKAAKHHAVEKDTTMKEMVTEALRRYLGIKGGGESSKK